MNTTPRVTLRNLLPKLPALLKNQTEVFHGFHQSHGDIYQIKLGGQQVFFIRAPHLIQQVLQTKHKQYPKSSLFHKTVIGFIMGNGLLTTSGESWQTQRRAMQPTFQHEAIPEITGNTVSITKKIMNTWPQNAGTAVEISTDMLKLVRLSIAECLFGEDAPLVSTEFEENRLFINKHLFKMTATWFWNSKTKRTMMENFLDMRGQIMQVIEKRLQAPHFGRNDILWMLMQVRDKWTGETFSPALLLDEMMTLIYAGYETTVKPLEWLWLLLAESPEVERKLHAEIDEQLEGRSPAFEDIFRMPYTWQVFSETMRLYPPAWMLGRVAAEDDVLDGHPIPKGSYIIVNIYSAHRADQYWDQPDEFIPERFETDVSQARPEFSYLPFGGGARNCLGKHLAMAELQLIVPTIVQKYRFTLVPGQNIKPKIELTLTPNQPIQFFIEPRAGQG